MTPSETTNTATATTEKVPSPIKAIRAKCLDCVGGSSPEVKSCKMPGCTLHPYRFGRKPTASADEAPPQLWPLTPLKAIRAKCLDCCCAQPEEVRLCPAEGCPVHPFRAGKNPNRARKGGPGRRFVTADK